METVTLLDLALVPVILFITQFIKKYFPKHLRVYIPGVLGFVFIPFIIIIQRQGIPPIPVFVSLWVWEGIKTGGAAVYFYMINQKGKKAGDQSETNQN